MDALQKKFPGSEYIPDSTSASTGNEIDSLSGAVPGATPGQEESGVVYAVIGGAAYSDSDLATVLDAVGELDVVVTGAGRGAEQWTDGYLRDSCTRVVITHPGWLFDDWKGKKPARSRVVAASVEEVIRAALALIDGDIWSLRVILVGSGERVDVAKKILKRLRLDHEKFAGKVVRHVP